MTLLQLRRLHSLGMLVSAQVVTAPNSAGWILEMKSDSGAMFSMSKTRTGEDGKHSTRIFNSIDAACSSATEIGFADVVVRLPVKKDITEEFKLT